MRYCEIRESANKKLEKEVVDLLHSASNPGVISKAVEFLRNKIKKKPQDPKITPGQNPQKTNTNNSDVQTDKVILNV